MLRVCGGGEGGACMRACMFIVPVCICGDSDDGVGCVLLLLLVVVVVVVLRCFGSMILRAHACVRTLPHYVCVCVCVGVCVYRLG